MTPSPHSIGRDRLLSEAHALMREHRIRHLPVLQGGKLIGLVSQRDLHLIETLRDVDPEKVTVEEAMSQEPYAVRPDASLEKVAAEMWAKKLGSAIVVEERSVVGVFTTIDALGALVTLLAKGRRRPAGPKRSGKAKPAPKAARRRGR